MIDLCFASFKIGLCSLRLHLKCGSFALLNSSQSIKDQAQCIFDLRCCFWLENGDLNIIYNEIRSRNMRKSTVKPLKRMQFVMHYDWINAFNLIILWWFLFYFFQLFRFISANLFISAHAEKFEQKYTNNLIDKHAVALWTCQQI